MAEEREDLLFKNNHRIKQQKKIVIVRMIFETNRHSKKKLSTAIRTYFIILVAVMSHLKYINKSKVKQ